MNFNFFIDALFPKKCVKCGTHIKDGVICEKCFAEININYSFFCGKCKARLNIPQKICHKDFPYILGAASSYNDEAIKTLIHYLKFKGIKEAAKPIAKIIIKYISNMNIDLKNYIVIPIPLSKNRNKERGFNQSEIIAQIFCENFKLQLECNSLFRNKNTPPQSSIKDGKKRKTNVKGCFSVINIENIKNKNIILIDDVTTSGATFYEATLALKSAGAKKIIALAGAMA
jgi:ComF family protein